MDQLIDAVGGRFKLTSLIQKRIRQMNERRFLGHQRKSDNEMIDEVLQEIADGKIELIPEVKEEPKEGPDSL